MLMIGPIHFFQMSQDLAVTPHRCIPVDRRNAELYSRIYIRPTPNFSGGFIMVWGISVYAAAELVVVNRGTITAKRYLKDLLQHHAVPYASLIDKEFVLIIVMHALM